MDTPYRTLSAFYKDKFGKRVYKLPIDGGFTCPNRNKNDGIRGCIFCNEQGSGEHTNKGDILNQVNLGINFAVSNNKGELFIAYFQNFTNTFAPVDVLREKYYSAFIDDRIVGISIATRPDCINEDVCKLLKEISKTHYVTVELGLQTASDLTANAINRGYKSQIYLDAVKMLKSFDIDFVCHLIVGLPNETISDIAKTVDFINILPPNGVKIHSLYVLKDTPLGKMYLNNKYTPITREYYLEAVSYILTHIPKDVVVHRLTGDGEKDKILAPNWTKEKKKNLNAIFNYMTKNNLQQGCFYKNNSIRTL